MLTEFGTTSGQAIIKAFLEECGGCRMRIPDMYDLYRADRDRLIRLRFDSLAREVGSSAAYEQLAIGFSLHVRQIRRIVNGD